MSKKSPNLKSLFFSFLSWRILLFFFHFISPLFFSLQKVFLGGGLKNYLLSPSLWAWLNFDGQHYLSLAYRGYQPLTHFYFPVYPLITRFLARLMAGDYLSYVYSGLLISNFSFFLAILGLGKLFSLNYKKKIVLTAILLILLFPTSFYFASFYTESLFLCLVVWSFYFARRKKWLLAGILGAIASGTRLAGIVLFPALFLEFYLQKRKEKKPDIGLLLFLSLIPLGLLAYMFFLQKTTGDPLVFLNTVAIFGEQRSSTFISLPRVFYRYFFKILPNLNFSYFPVVFSTFLELASGLLFLFLSITGLSKIRLSYWFYLLGGYILSTLSGSFSSLPRYVLVLFPGFLLISLWLCQRTRYFQIIFFMLSFLLLAVATALFARGYWIS